MGLLSWLGIGNAAGNGLSTVAKTVNDIVSQWVTNPAERAEQVDKILQAAQTDVASARTFATAYPGDTGFSAFADGVNKMIRPALAIGVIGGLYGWWRLPDVSHLPDFYATLGYSVIGFYFGVVSVVDDLPRGVAKLLTAIKG